MDTLIKKEYRSIDDIELGTIFYDSWGYDQTNVDFYKVIRKTAKMVEVVAIGQHKVEDTSWASENVIANPDRILYDYDYYFNGETPKEKGWELDPDQSSLRYSRWDDTAKNWIDDFTSTRYRKPKITRHLPTYTGEGCYIRTSSYSHARIWDNKPLHQSHWA